MKISIFWFRRDLRLHDNAAFYHALKGDHPVLPLFIFDRNILDELPEEDARVEFIHGVMHELREELKEHGGALEVQYDTPEAAWKFLLEKYDIGAVYTNHDYEPYAKNRDEKIKKLLTEQNIELHTFKDHVIFERDEVVKGDGDPYVVFTPYSRVWKSKLDSRIDKDENGEEISYYFKAYPNKKYFPNLHQSDPKDIPTLEHMGFENTKIEIPDRSVTQGLIRTYDETRNFPAIEGTSRLGIHFRFGTISIREKARKARKLNETFLNELIWRDFYSMIMNHFPKVVDNAFRAKYDTIHWRNDKEDFQKWCEGKTGYPIVDAGMRELNNTGYMHNRVRMITASFLTKHLLIDWRWGEAYFAEKLLDYDLASNNGGWQWAAGSGTDAAPYFRIFNPTSQQKKFDKDLKYIKEWIPEYGTADYPEAMVDHKEARQRCLDTYKTALDNAGD
ncbi:MAG: deoxyribodipyrimidine photo-lyase [Bacteroidota bacterium]